MYSVILPPRWASPSRASFADRDASLPDTVALSSTYNPWVLKGTETWYKGGTWIVEYSTRQKLVLPIT